MYNPPDPKSYNALVWEIVKEIPDGIVSTYGQIASMIPPPENVDPEQYLRLSPRWVGTAMNATPSGEGIPWQRVINSQGKISLPKGSSSADQQRGLLEMEGVEFDEQGRVDFEIVGWEGPSEDWLAAHDLLPPRPLKKRSGPQATQPSLF
jgi:methylated-DNA-protein-cysteine methyltransferase-like protein